MADHLRGRRRGALVLVVAVVVVLPACNAVDDPTTTSVGDPRLLRADDLSRPFAEVADSEPADERGGDVPCSTTTAADVVVSVQFRASSPPEERMVQHTLETFSDSKAAERRRDELLGNDWLDCARAELARTLSSEEAIEGFADRRAEVGRVVASRGTTGREPLRRIRAELLVEGATAGLYFDYHVDQLGVTVSLLHSAGFGSPLPERELSSILERLRARIGGRGT